MNRRDLFKRALGLVGLGAIMKVAAPARAKCAHAPGEALCLNCPVGFESWTATYEPPPLWPERHWSEPGCYYSFKQSEIALRPRRPWLRGDIPIKDRIYISTEFNREDMA